MGGEEEEAMSALSRKELRKLKLAEYLAAKGRLKVPNPKPYLREKCPTTKQPVTSAPRVVDVKENKAPQKTVGSVGFKSRAAAAASRPAPATKVLSVSNKVNIQGSAAALQKKTSRPVLSSSLTRLRPNQNHKLTRTDTAAASKSSLRPAAGAKTQPGSRVLPFTRAPPNAPRTLVVKPSSRISVGSKPALSGPTASASSRISLGPLVRTRTGLTPAVPQPRVTKPFEAHTSATADAAVPARKAPSRRTLPGSLSHSSVAGRAEVKGQRETEPNSKPLPGKRPPPSCNNRPPRGFGPTSSRPALQPAGGTTKSKSAAERGRAAAQTTSDPTSQSGFRASRPAGGQKTTNPTTRSSFRGSRPAGSQTTSRPAGGQTTSRPAGGQKTANPTTRSSFRGSRPAGGQTTSDPAARSRSRASRPAAAELQRKPNTDRKEPNGSAKVRPGAAAAPHTAPQPLRNVRLTGHATNITKTPKVTVKAVPQTEGKKVTAAQEERMRKLQEWRQAKGISYKRPSMPAPPSTARRPAPVSRPFWESMKKEDDAHSLICAVDRSLADCIQLLEEGCPPDQVGGVLSRLPPVSQKFTRYWICRARLMEQEGDLDVLPLFEEAVRVVAEPVDELRTVVFEILKRKDEIQASEKESDAERAASREHSPQAGPDSTGPDSTGPDATGPDSTGPDATVTPNPVRALIWGQSGDSSVVKYKITATPGGPPSQKRPSARVDGQEVRFFTPVRRSVRIERSQRKYPAALQDHDPCVASYDDLFSEEGEGEVGGVAEPSEESGEGPMYVYRENEALGDKVHVRLVYDDSP